ncbi:MAG TPA: amidohydrolase, partial [Candidatus Paceibacterota bacterium]|nr:amidohydrolase [Candidatus Paceibacterota bacterium]
MLALVPRLGAVEALLFQHAIVHTVSGETLTNGSVLVLDGKIHGVFDDTKPTRMPYPTNTAIIDLHGQHLYPGLIALDTALGLSEIEAVRATRDTTEVGEFTPDVLSW